VTTRIAVGLDNAQQGQACGRNAARAALDALGQPPVSLALLFTSHPHPDHVLQGINGVLGKVPLIGATSAGEYSHQGYVEQGAGVMLIQSDDMRFHPMKRQQRRLFASGTLLGPLQGTSERGLGSPFNHRTLMLFPDDQSMNLDRVVERAMTETALLYNILGGPGLTQPTAPQSPAVFYNDQLLRTGLSGTEILSRVPLGLALANGWTPISGPYRVTQSGERRVVTMDGRPAREVYEDFFQTHQIQFTEDTLSETLLRYPIGICKDDDCKVSVVMGCDRGGALTVTSPPPADNLIYILSTEPDAMITAAEQAIRQALQKLGEQPKVGALFIDCVSTGMVLAEAYQQQRAAVERCMGDLPFLSFRSHGVLARFQGQTSGHHECSVATCVLPG
jgi:hypothetical protein